MLTIAAGLLASRAAASATCGKEMQMCAPSGATTSHLPPLGPSLSTLYLDLLETVSGIHFTNKRSSSSSLLLSKRDDSTSDSTAFCCSAATSCLLLSSSTCPGKIPLCYDKYTTNFVLPDGTTGTVALGSLSLPDGSSADLFTGAYTNASSHVSGNLYDDDSSSSSSSSAVLASDKPNTATLSIPPVYTAAGVGSAIPISALGTLITSVVTRTETFVSSHTVPATTRAAPETDARGSTVAPATTRSKETVEPTTVVSVVESTMTEEAGAATATGSGSGAVASASASASGSPTPSGFTGAAAGRGNGGMGLLAVAVGAAAVVL
ncbi:hypothetical protein IWZ01DRAFT_544105 [Phyllosticta capitalensis]